MCFGTLKVASPSRHYPVSISRLLQNLDKCELLVA
jgi:hypothetical protein